MSHPATFDDKKYGDFVNYTIWIENYIDKKGLGEEFIGNVLLILGRK